MIAIIGILAVGVVALLNPKTQINKAQDAKRKSDLLQIKNALESYYNDHQAYPTLAWANRSCLSYPGNIAWECWFTDKAAFMMNPNGTNYIATMPVDPAVKDNNSACTAGDTISRAYGYYSKDGQSYVLFTRLEYSDSSSPNYHNGSNIDGVGCSGFANYKIQVP